MQKKIPTYYNNGIEMQKNSWEIVDIITAVVVAVAAAKKKTIGIVGFCLVFYSVSFFHVSDSLRTKQKIV